eukprot:m.79396 g.79396  ORF g.79396 m.79396 type:complete len:135 (+) comp12713_c0_seq1:131-535(+)
MLQGCSFRVVWLVSFISFCKPEKLSRISQRHATDHSVTADEAFEQAAYETHHGCVVLEENQLLEIVYQDRVKEKFVTQDLCAKYCASQAYTVFGIASFFIKDERRCWCADEFHVHEVSRIQTCEAETPEASFWG